MRLKWFPPLKSAPKPREFIAFDTEDDNGGYGEGSGFYLGCVHTPEGSHLFVRKHQMIRFLCQSRWGGYWCAAHNLEYDLLNLFGPAGVVKLQPVFSGSKMVSATLKVGPGEGARDKLLFFDTSAFLAQSLAKLARLVGLEKMEMSHRAGERTVTPRKREYCARDTLIAWKLAHFLQDGFMKLGAQLRLTAASTALDLFRRRFQHERLPVLDDRVREIVYHAYHGGRVECFRLGEVAGPVYSNDFKGMYSSCMADLNLPSLASLEVTHGLDLAGEGVADVDLEVPTHLWAGPVPVKEEKLAFPVGRVRGWFPINELRNSLNYGCKIIRVRQVVQSAKTYPYLREYALTLNKVREETTEEVVTTVVKLASNSLYGKFGARNAEWEYMPVSEWVRRVSERTLGAYDASRTVELPAYGIVRVCRFSDFPPYSNVVWPAAITAAARVKLYPHLQEDSTLYCDTDSVIGFKEYGQSKRIGSLVCKEIYDRLIIRGNKMYAGHLVGRPQTRDGWDAHAKGFPREEALAVVQHPEKVVRCRRPTHFRTALQGERRANEWVTVPRECRAEYDKRTLVGSGEQTLPLTVSMW